VKEWILLYKYMSLITSSTVANTTVKVYNTIFITSNFILNVDKLLIGSQISFIFSKMFILWILKYTVVIKIAKYIYVSDIKL